MRPSVIVCTTSDILAEAYKVMFESECRRLGLRLQICPGASGRVSQSRNANAYGDIEELFEYLDSLDIEILANCQVWVDLSPFEQIQDAFAARTIPDSPPLIGHRWTNQKRVTWGPAARLVLKFPLIFPVFIHPVLRDFTFRFHGDNPQWSRDIKSSFFLRKDFHLVSPVQGNISDTKMFYKPLDYFANGHRCYFDPTGLRSTVKAAMLGLAIGETVTNGREEVIDTKAASGSVKILLDRLDKDCVVVEDEADQALLNAYIGWRKGFRAWLTTTYAALEDGEPNPSGNIVTNRMIIRDFDLRFPDVPSGAHRRKELMDVDKWPKPGWRTDNMQVRVISACACIHDEHNLCIRKPIQYLHQPMVMGSFLSDFEGYGELPIQTMMTRLETVQGQAVAGGNTDVSKGHGAPYANLAIAESLITRARQSQDSASCSLLAALLAHEAYELLLGMGLSSSLDALAILHIREVDAEVTSIGIANQIDLGPRAEEIEKTLDILLPKSEERGITFKQEENRRTRKEFLLRLWGEIRSKLKNSEHFEESEHARQLVLTYSSLLNSSLLRDLGDMADWLARIALLSFKLLFFVVASLILIMSLYFIYQLTPMGADCGHPFILTFIVGFALSLMLLAPYFFKFNKIVLPETRPIFIATIISPLIFFITGWGVNPNKFNLFIRYMPFASFIIASMCLGNCVLWRAKRERMYIFQNDLLANTKYHWVLPMVNSVRTLVESFVVFMILLSVAYVIAYSEHSSMPRYIKTCSPFNSNDILHGFVPFFARVSGSCFGSSACFIDDGTFYLRSLLQVVLSTLHMGIAPGVLPVQDYYDKKAIEVGVEICVLVFSHYIISYIVLGIFIALVFRKFSRG